MEYTVIIKDRSYDLPDKTLKVVEDMDTVVRIDEKRGMSIRDKYKRLYDFIVGLVGTENAKEILGSDNIEEVDLCEVTLTVKKILDAYEQPLLDYQTKQMEEQLRRVPIEKMAGITQTIDSITHISLAKGKVSQCSR